MITSSHQGTTDPMEDRRPRSLVEKYEDHFSEYGDGRDAISACRRGKREVELMRDVYRRAPDPDLEFQPGVVYPLAIMKTQFSDLGKNKSDHNDENDDLGLSRRNPNECESAFELFAIVVEATAYRVDLPQTKVHLSNANVTKTSTICPEKTSPDLFLVRDNHLSSRGCTMASVFGIARNPTSSECLAISAVEATAHRVDLPQTKVELLEANVMNTRMTRPEKISPDLFLERDNHLNSRRCMVVSSLGVACPSAPARSTSATSA